MTMSAACRTGYVSRPWLTSSGWLAFFSLYVGVRSSQLTGVTVASSQASSVCSGRCDWTKTRTAFGIQTQGDERGRHLACPLAEHVGIVEARERVVVDDAVDRLVLVLETDVVADRAEIVAQVRGAGRLDPGEDAGPGRGRGRDRGRGGQLRGHRRRV